MLLPEPIQNLITAFERLPGIGPKSASRLAFYLLRAPEDVAQSLAEALVAAPGTEKLAECGLRQWGAWRCHLGHRMRSIANTSRGKLI